MSKDKKNEVDILKIPLESESVGTVAEGTAKIKEKKAEKLVKKTKADYSRFVDKSKLKSVVMRINKATNNIEKTALGNDPRLAFKSLPTSLIGLNRKLLGGFQRRRIHMTYGAKSSGKTFFDYKNIAYLQRLCRNCLGVLPFEDTLCNNLTNYFLFPDCSCDDPKSHMCQRIDYESDYESSAEPENTDLFKEKLTHMESIGVIPELLVITFASSMDECIDIVKEVIPKQDFDYISIDSLQGGQTEYVYGREGNADTIGIDPRKLNILLRDIMYGFHSGGIDAFLSMPVVHIISQVRLKIGPTMSYESFSGGKGLEHMNSLILQFKRSAYITDTGTEVSSIKPNNTDAIRIAYKAEKSKMGSEPYFSGSVDFYIKQSNSGFVAGDVNHVLELIDLGIKDDIIKRKGTYYVVGDTSFQGKSKLANAFMNNPELVKSLMGGMKK